MASSLTQAHWQHGSAVAASGSFVPPDVFGRLSTITAAECDRLDFGVVRLDDAGVVEIYNRYEANLAGLDPTGVLGKNFFTQVAPCTNNRMFRGAFATGVERGAMDVRFPYTFTYRMAPTAVDVHLHRAGGRNWLFVRKV